jgi:copper chaperone CopZ
MDNIMDRPLVGERIPAATPVSEHRNCHLDPVHKTPAQEELATVTDTVLRVSGMGCPTCAMRVRNALVSQTGVIDAQVDHVGGRALVRYNPHMLAPQDLLPLVEAAGNDGRHTYRAVLI